jgi:hypothetical protein
MQPHVPPRGKNSISDDMIQTTWEDADHQTRNFASLHFPATKG